MARRLRTILSTDTGLTVLLVSLVVTLFVIFPFFEPRGIGRLVASASVSLFLISGALTLTDQPLLRKAVVALGAVALGVRWLGHVVEIDAVAIVGRVATLAFTLVLTGGVLARVLRPGRITSHRIQGAIAVYLLLGFGWALAFSLTERVEPGSFSLPTVEAEPPGGSGGKSGDDDRMGHFVYFSFVTLTTLGYGDIAPKSPGARTLVILEALAGQLFIGILIARLVSLQIVHSEP